MDAELAAFDNEWKNGSRAVAKAQAQVWLDAHPDVRAQYDALSIETLVGMVSDLRGRGDEEGRIRVDVYLLAGRPQQFIEGRGGE